MLVRIFTIPIHGGDAAAEAVNRFLGGHRILGIERAFIQDGANSAWSLCVSYEPAGDGEGRPAGAKRGGKVDYREVLSQEDFVVYAQLRSLRKELAETEGVPAYTLFTNDQLAEMVQRRVQSRAAMGEIPGVGDARLDKYGERFLTVLQEARAAAPAKAGPRHEA